MTNEQIRNMPIALKQMKMDLESDLRCLMVLQNSIKYLESNISAKRLKITAAEHEWQSITIDLNVAELSEDEEDEGDDEDDENSDYSDEGHESDKHESEDDEDEDEDDDEDKEYLIKSLLNNKPMNAEMFSPSVESNFLDDITAFDQDLKEFDVNEVGDI